MTTISESSQETLAARLPGVDDVTGLSIATPTDAPSEERRLRHLLLECDVVALAVAWFLLPLATHRALLQEPLALAAVCLVVCAALVCLWLQHLYLARICRVRSLEVVRLAKACAASAVLAFLILDVTDADVPPGAIGLHASVALVLLVVERGLFRSWLRGARAAGRHVRSVVLVGIDEDAEKLVRLVRDEPELGYRIAGVVCNREQLPVDCPVAWLGSLERLHDVLRECGARGVIVTVGALASRERNDAVRTLIAKGVHVEMSIGLERIDWHRLRPVALAHEPILYVEASNLAAWQRGVKRGFDVIISLLLLVVCAPILAVAAIAIAISDGRPVLYRQSRIGKGGRPFRLVKLRTMTRDADERVAGLLASNDRRDGPLFKMASDPRVTPVGRVLRATSIDELPQLWNVLRHEMSLVGPRPPLPREADLFDDELQDRFQMLPGITGLWQVEARDNPSFGVYRHLDLFYVENWSLGLDCAIVVATAGVVVRGALGAARLGSKFR